MRLANATDVQHPIAVRAVLELHWRGEVLHITPQVLIEFRNVATRPKSANGAGLPIADTEAHAGTFEAKFPLLADTPDIYPTWKTLEVVKGAHGLARTRPVVQNVAPAPFDHAVAGVKALPFRSQGSTKLIE